MAEAKAVHRIERDAAVDSGFAHPHSELLLGARYLELGDLRIPLRSLKLVTRSKDNTDLALILSASGAAGGVAALFMTGGDSRVANGMQATAKIAADIDIPVDRLTPMAAIAGPPIVVAPATGAPSTTTTTTTTTTKE